MKFSLIAAVVVLALAQGSFAQDATDLEKLSQYFEDMKTKMTTELTAIMQNQDFANQAETVRTQLEPLATKLKEVATNIEEQLKPLTDNIQAQAQPMVDNFQKQMEAIFQKVTEHTKALAN
ncbi:type-4 ice-structuring protein LS-12-like [Amphiprion ocellaris]|uniref:Antifreeze protein type IV n=1 Tax=Amphiprion ocellaris TaxID=80972 RepID=A0A3Q1CUN6_AMPOC|nr:type-4 ice-structuring protein LS-12-like [Amphiprion ocellaris]